MTGISGLSIEESKEELEVMLKKEKNLRNKQRLQVLYLMQSEHMAINKIATSMGKHRATIHRWLEQYRSGGLGEMLSIKKPTGRPKKIPHWAVKSLEKQLERPEGFKSYGQIQRWLETTLGITAAYRTVHELTRYRLKAKLKVGQKPSPIQDREKIEAFKKNLGDDLALVSQYMEAKLAGKYQKKRYFCADESRFGLHTILRRLITKVGVKPARPAQMLFKAFWLYGAVEPATGESVFWHYSHVDTKCFQHFINDLAKRFPDSLNFLQVDNAKFHKSKSLKIPENIILLFQPPHSPELNPIERMWGYIKQFLAWDVFDNLEQLHQKVDEILLSLTSEVISSVTGFEFILDALSVASF